MKEYDQVKLITEKAVYAKKGVHKGMDGWICYEQKHAGNWLVCFDDDKYFDEYPIINVLESDLQVIVSSEADSSE